MQQNMIVRNTAFSEVTRTLQILPKLYVVLDDWFQTVPSSSNTKVNFDHDDWYKTFSLTEWRYTPDDDNDDGSAAIPVPKTTSSGAIVVRSSD